MSFGRDPSAAAARRQHTAIGTVRELAEAGLLTFGSMALAFVFFPLLVLGSAAVLLSLSWPLFVGAYLEYGFVPGTPNGSRQPLGGTWYLLTFAWLGLLAVAPVVVGRYRAMIRLPRTEPDGPSRPRPRV